MNKRMIIGIILILILGVVFTNGIGLISNWSNRLEDLEYKKDYLEIRGNTCAKELFFENACNSIGGKAKLKGCDGDFYFNNATLYCRFNKCITSAKLDWKTNKMEVISTTCEEKDEALQIGEIGAKIRDPKDGDISSMICISKNGC